MSEHWLWRLGAPEWLAAAEAELEAADANIRSRRTAVTHARRAGGMALNAVLVARFSQNDPAAESRWGRSYMDHLRALASHDGDDPILPGGASLAHKMLQAPVAPAPLVRLQTHRDADVETAIAAARDLLALCRHVIQAPV